jgi:large subunit ribosomal protein L12e
VQLSIVDRQATILILTTTSTLIIQALKESHRDRKKQKNARHTVSLSLDTFIEIARQMRPKSMSKSLLVTVKEVLGTAQTIGDLCNGQPAKLIQQRITSGEIAIPSE